MPPRIAFVYPNPRAELLAQVSRGEAPDSTLLGQNHLAALGLDARGHVPALTGRGRLAWHVRELPLPWELGDADIAVTPLANLFPLTARVRRRPRVVVVNYGLNLIWRRSGQVRRSLLRASLRAAAAVVCLGESQREELLELTGLPPARVRTVLLGIDGAFFARDDVSEAREDGRYVLAVGKDLSRDYATLAEALRPLDVPAELVALPRNVEGVELPRRARLRVGLPATELRALYAGAACAVVAQRRDGYPYGSEGGGLTALLEAMAMGLPVVATERAILRDYVRDGETALLVPPEDPAALREAVEVVLRDRELAARLGLAAHTRLTEGFTTRHLAERLAPLLRELPGGGG